VSAYIPGLVPPRAEAFTASTGTLASITCDRSEIYAEGARQARPPSSDDVTTSPRGRSRNGRHQSTDHFLAHATDAGDPPRVSVVTLLDGDSIKLFDGIAASA